MSGFQFDQLSYLVMKQIFLLLSLPELVRCRAVCRQFKFYADQAEVHRLVVSDEHKRRTPRCWHLNARPIDYKGSIGWSEFAHLKPTQFNLNRQLKFLHICVKRTFSLAILCRFEQLVHLELYLEAGDHRTKTLGHPELKMLKFYCWFESCVLQTPKLEVLSCDRIGVFQFRHPETIKRLESDYDNHSFMSKFSNLEFFKCETEIGEVKPNLLSVWKNLKELDLKNQATRGLDARLKSSLANFLKQKKISKREDLKCFLESVELIDESQLKDYGPARGRAHFQLKYNKLLRGSHPNVFSVDYSTLTSWTHNLSDDFFDKFPSIYTVQATLIVDRDQFEGFLKNVNNLNRLSLTDTSLDQAFMDNLSNVCSHLMHLTINGNQNLTNFNFILTFKYLTIFKTDHQFEGSFELAAKAFDKSNFYDFQFREGQKQVQINRNLISIKATNGTYDLMINNKLVNGRVRKVACCERNLSWSQLIDHWEQRKKVETSMLTRNMTIRGKKRFKART